MRFDKEKRLLNNQKHIKDKDFIIISNEITFIHFVIKLPFIGVYIHWHFIILPQPKITVNFFLIL